MLRFLCFLLVGLGAFANAPAQYSFTDLGPTRIPAEVNNMRSVIGNPGTNWYLGSQGEGFFQGLGGSNRRWVYDISESEAACGTNDNATDPLYWPSPNLVPSVLGKIDGCFSYGPIALNSSGVVIGDCAATVNNQFLGRVPIMWRDGVPTLLRQLSGVDDVNERGDILGSYFRFSSDFSSFVSYPVVLKGSSQLNLLPPDARYADSARMNDRGEVAMIAVYAQTPTERPTLFSDGKYLPLELPSGTTSVYINDINNSGWVLGSCTIAGVSRPVLWRGTKATMVQDLFAQAKSPYIVRSALRLNDRGDIVGAYAQSTDPSAQGGGYILKRNVPWGAYVKVTFRNGEEREDYLVALQEKAIVLASDIQFKGQTVSCPVGSRVPLSSIDSIRVESPPALATPSMNMYLQLGLNQCARLATPVCYTGAGGWKTLKTVFNLTKRVYEDQPGVAPVCFVAVPRVSGRNNQAYAQQSMASFAGATTLPDGWTKARPFSPQILYGTGWHESYSAKLKSGWNQFGFVTGYRGETVFDETAYPGFGQYTMATPDGGIGIMQLTAETALETTRPPQGLEAFDLLEKRMTHVWRLAADPAYNAEAGAYLIALRGWGTGNAYASVASPLFLNHWYKSLPHYRGIAGAKNEADYISDVWNSIRTGAYGAGASAPSTARLSDLLSGQDAQYGDWNCDGIMDFRLRAASWKVAPKGGIVVTVTVSEFSSDLPLDSVRASFLLAGVPSANVAMVRGAGGVYRATIPGKVPTSTKKLALVFELSSKGQSGNAVIEASS